MSKKTLAWLCLISICIIWGTTYLAIRVAVADKNCPPLLFACLRQFAACVVILAVGYGMNRQIDLSLNNIIRQATIGFLLISIGNGAVTWAEQSIPSGVTALLCSLMPLCAVIINLIWSRDLKINALIIGGLLMGIAGVATMFKEDASALADSRNLGGVLATLAGTSSWALGSVYNQRQPKANNPVFNSGLQLLLGGVVLAVASLFLEGFRMPDFSQTHILWPFLYLVIFGSILGYTAFMFALKHLPVGIVTLYAYVNPLVAVILGFYLLNEPLSIYTAASFVLIIGGVWVVNTGYKRIKRQSLEKVGG